MIENGYDRHQRHLRELIALIVKQSQENDEGKTLRKLVLRWKDNRDGTLSIDGYEADWKYPRKPKVKKQ